MHVKHEEIVFQAFFLKMVSYSLKLLQQQAKKQEILHDHTGYESLKVLTGMHVPISTSGEALIAE